MATGACAAVPHPVLQPGAPKAKGDLKNCLPFEGDRALTLTFTSPPQLLRSLDDWSVLVHDADMVDALIDQKQVGPYTTHTPLLCNAAHSHHSVRTSSERANEARHARGRDLLVELLGAHAHPWFNF